MPECHTERGEKSLKINGGREEGGRKGEEGNGDGDQLLEERV